MQEFGQRCGESGVPLNGELVESLQSGKRCRVNTIYLDARMRPAVRRQRHSFGRRLYENPHAWAGSALKSMSDIAAGQSCA
eukprot:7119736-Pyramimonas_sp.AAC.1